jgi:hypothetical protein
VLSSGVEDQLPSVVLDVSLDAKGSVDLVPLLCLLISAALSAPGVIRFLLFVPGDIRSAGRGLWAGGCRSHALKIDPSAKSLNTNGFMREKY